MIALLTFLELVLGCHCSTWRMTSNGPRCAVVVQRCEFVDGFHYLAPWTPACTRACGDWQPGEKVAGR